nr:GNAT family N-acetyltransferase [uncultured Allomuricauda sp.]
MNKFDLEHEVFINQSIPSLFKERNTLERKMTDLDFEKNCILYTRVPDYLSFCKNEEISNLGMRKAIENQGYRMNLKDCDSVDHYLSSRFGRSSRYKLRREKKRLEQCFNPSYKMWQEKIERSHYDFIYDELFRLLEVRSEEKNIEDNYYFDYKEKYRDVIFQLLHQKKASVHVIYVGENPIDICINFIKGKTVYQFIRTYDIAFSKFKTGYINLIKHLEWAIDQGFESIVFGPGNVEWKEKWCNETYNYNKIVFYNSNSLRMRMKSFVFIMTYNIKSMVRTTKFKIVIDKIFQKPKAKTSNKKKKFSFELKSSEDLELKFLNLLDLNTQDTYFRRFLFNYMYDNKINLANVQIFNSPKQDLYVLLLKDLENKFVIKKL